MFSLGLEIKAIRTVTSNEIKEGYRTAMLGRLTLDHFSSEITRKAIRRLKKLLEVKGEVLDWDDLLEDPNLTEEFRDSLAEAEERPAKGMKGFDKIFTNLERYRKRRALMKLGKEIAKTLDKESDEDFDEDDYLRTTADSLNQATGGSAQTEKVYSFGDKKLSALKLVNKVIDCPTEMMYKTGYNSYDSKNGGFPQTGVVLLAGSTSGGKSVLATNLQDKMAYINAIKTLKVTLEMTAEQETKRYISMITGIPMWKIKQGKMTEREKSNAKKLMKEYHKKMRKAKGQSSYISPERGMSIDDILYMTIPYGVQITFIDYVGLLEGVDGDNQWQQLSGIVRKAKVHTQRTGQLVVILCQSDDSTGKIRYSGGMREHADVVWAWNYSDPETRETHILPVQVMKARDGELFEMPLEEKFDVMRILDAAEGTQIPESAKGAISDDKGNKNFKKGGKFKKRDNSVDIKKNKRASLLSSSDDGDEDDAPRKKKKKNAYLVS